MWHRVHEVHNFKICIHLSIIRIMLTGWMQTKFLYFLLIGGPLRGPCKLNTESNIDRQLIFYSRIETKSDNETYNGFLFSLALGCWLRYWNRQCLHDYSTATLDTELYHGWFAKKIATILFWFATPIFFFQFVERLCQRILWMVMDSHKITIDSQYDGRGTIHVVLVITNFCFIFQLELKTF